MPSIAIWNRCNNHCLMCTNPQIFQSETSVPYSFENLKKRWSNRPIKANQPLCFTGGEPTIHPDFFKIIDWFHLQYPKSKIVIASNGRIFFYQSFLNKILQHRPLLLEIALHGYNEKTHDAVTRIPGSFKQTIAGIHNILSSKTNSQELEIRIILTKLTLRNLDKILGFINKEFDYKKIKDIVLIFLELEGQAQDNLSAVAITYAQAAKYIPPAVARWSSVFRDLRLYHFPLCTLPPKLWPFCWRTLRGEEVMFLAGCSRCPVKPYCLGIHRDYISLIGSQEFKPPQKIKLTANSTFYQPIDAVFT